MVLIERNVARLSPKLSLKCPQMVRRDIPKTRGRRIEALLSLVQGRRRQLDFVEQRDRVEANGVSSSPRQ